MRSLKPLDRIVVLVFPIKREARLIQRFGSIGTVRKGLDDQEQVGASLRPVAVREIDSRATQGFELRSLHARFSVKRVEAFSSPQGRVIASARYQLIESGPRR
jgi:hypothetical protein